MAEFDLSPLEPVLERYRRQDRSVLLEVLHDAQEIFGYLPEEVAAEIGKALKIPAAEVYGVIEFYALFYSKPVGKTVIHICNDPVCALAGSETILKRMTSKVETTSKKNDFPLSVTIEKSPCLGLCEHAPTLLVQGKPLAKTASQSLEDIINGKGSSPYARIGGDVQILTQNCGCDHTTWLDEYKSLGGYEAFQKALKMDRRQIIEEVKSSGLVGRGGAAFPTGIKWQGALDAQTEPKYIICNADEAEPGTFKDRVMMEDVPHRILEGLLIGAYAIGANKGYIYIRGEYRTQYEIMQQAVKEANTAGFLGENILNSGWNFELEIRRGAGAYICGEETAQFDSIEGKRGFPRVKPPFPTTYGLFGKPTVINNVETFCNIPYIIRNGAAVFREMGTEKSPGSKLFCLSGDVEKPGLYEIPFGTSFRHLLEDLGGGVRGGKQFQAALFGGAAGAFASPDQLDTLLTFEDLRQAGLVLGAGAIIVFDEDRDLRDVLQRLGHFFLEESCGKCYPCQLGTQKQYEILCRIAEGKTLPGDRQRLEEIGRTMSDSSLCGLGQTASMAVLSALKHWPGLFMP